jgi:hypothetical protein
VWWAKKRSSKNIVIAERSEGSAFVEDAQTQVLRLRLAQKTHQTSLRMTVYFFWGGRMTPDLVARFHHSAATSTLFISAQKTDN